MPLPEPAVDQFTCAQIHDSSHFPNKPLIRLVWRRSRSGISDHIWSVIRKSVDQDAVVWNDLGPRTDGFNKFEIQVKANKLKVNINDQTKVEVDVAYWQHLNNYFKAGIYLQSDGYATVNFKSLKFFNQ